MEKFSCSSEQSASESTHEPFIQRSPHVPPGVPRFMAREIPHKPARSSRVARSTAWSSHSLFFAGVSSLSGLSLLRRSELSTCPWDSLEYPRRPTKPVYRDQAQKPLWPDKSLRPWGRPSFVFGRSAAAALRCAATGLVCSRGGRGEGAAGAVSGTLVHAAPAPVSFGTSA
jgi:hypothetical protein